MVFAIRYETTTQESRSTSPKFDAIDGNAVATMVWSATARNIGSMIDGNTDQNSERDDDFAAAALEVSASGGISVIGHRSGGGSGTILCGRAGG